MFKVAILLTAALVASVSSNGEFSVLTSPSSLEFKGDERLDSSLLSDVISSSLGHAIESQENWNGLYIRNPFKLPKTAVVFLVDGVDTVSSDAIKGRSYPVAGNEHNLNALAARFDDSLTIDLENNNEAVAVISETFGEIKPVPKKVTASGLKPSINTEDEEFLNKLATIEALSKKMESTTAAEKTLPSLILVRLSLAALRESHQDTPTANAEASELVAQQLAIFVDAAQKYFGDSVLVATVASSESLARHRRDTAAAAAAGAVVKPRDDTEEVDINLAKEYNESYPVVFNIILWFGIVMFFSLLAICLAIGNMDPGRDSIIYRMTSTRIKKDN